MEVKYSNQIRLTDVFPLMGQYLILKKIRCSVTLRIRIKLPGFIYIITIYCQGPVQY
jgi:hypothetical protein